MNIPASGNALCAHLKVYWTTQSQDKGETRGLVAMRGLLDPVLPGGSAHHLKRVRVFPGQPAYLRAWAHVPADYVIRLKGH